jgi:hypothetical protein
MIAHMLADGRLLGFGIGDWSMLLGGVAVTAGLLMLLL